MEKSESSRSLPNNSYGLACSPKVTLGLLSDQGKGVAFADAGSSWKLHRKLVFSTFTLLKDDQKLEKLSE